MSLSLLALFFGSYAPPALVSASLASASKQRALFLLQLAIGVLGPIAGLALFSYLGYRTWSWWPFAYGSLLPTAVACSGMLLATFLALMRQPFTVSAKVGVFLLCALAWFLLFPAAGVMVACSMGDCL